MTYRLILLTLAFLLGTGASTRSLAKNAEPHRLVPRQQAVENVSALDYLLYLPPEYPHRETHPLLLFLHGSDQRGDDLERVKAHGPPRLIEAGRDFPFLVVSPQCPSGSWWNPAELNTLLDHLISTYRVDTNRIYVTGLSMGGYGTWALAAAFPERIAAIVPVCGGGDPAQAGRLKQIPAWVFHGARDEAVDLSESQKMVDALRAAGGTVQFTLYRRAKHADTWKKAYQEEALWEWLLRRHKGP